MARDALCYRQYSATCSKRLLDEGIGAVLALYRNKIFSILSLVQQAHWLHQLHRVGRVTYTKAWPIPSQYMCSSNDRSRLQLLDDFLNIPVCTPNVIITNTKNFSQRIYIPTSKQALSALQPSKPLL